MVWGAIVGGVVGAVVGGPVGAAVGALLGAGAEALGEPRHPQLGGIQWVRWPADGLFFRVDLGGVVGAEAVLVTAHDAEGIHLPGGVPGWSDEDGDFFLAGDVDGTTAYFFIPDGVIQPPEGRLRLQVRAVRSEAPVLLGVGMYEVEVPRAEFHAARFWAPLLILLMEVARADGHLDREELRVVGNVVRDGLEIPAEEGGLVREILRTRDGLSMEDRLFRIQARAPGLEPDAIVGAMADVARADGVIHPAEVRVIREVALLFGLAEGDWPELAAALALDVEDRRRRWLETLGLVEGCTERDIQRAFREKMREHHPDRYQGFSEEYQEVAHRMALRLIEARDGLLGA